MLFNSLDFIIFFVVVFTAYVWLPHRGQNILLLVASYFFYGCWDWRFLSLIALSTTVDFVASNGIYRSDDPQTRKRLLVFSIVINLGILGFFKYFNFFVDSATALLAGFGLETPRLNLHIILPVGISFYTFQSMSYTLDVYRGQLVPTRRFTDYALFVSLFTQLVAGPIERAKNLLSQVTSPRVVTWSGIQTGTWLFFWGLFKKVVIGDNLALLVDQVFGGSVAWNTGSVLLGIYAFALQIYCDFSAYSDMARGLGMYLGFNIMINFRNPYFALNPSELWRRWHISLSTWLRDYLYIPLGGNRRGPRRTYINLLLTMVLGGLWHGAAWTFVLWGAFHGGLLALHRWFQERWPPAPTLSWAGRGWRTLAMFHATCFGWLLFRANSMRDVTGMLKALLQPGWLPEFPGWIFQILLLALPLLGIQIRQERTQDPLAPLRLSLFPRIILYTFMLFMLVTYANTGSRAFIYFQF
ncbi:MAG TPA: MBOAT family O-acyltransferase [Kiritimatiellia bacterium]|jgi:D-alanyl-lipoteichoic acid acyltransferase DltB (MBOAT superfamily)|nr:MBOAT family protein [Kiritimatiellia bacterium]MBP9572522.1 MBOAT family protein [Kiritimatiellia bacterium]OQC60086.1 MAG: Peptidoglycan O-acetyltransferase [Verrucomicrobia bacterium ADurb.Bin018]HOE36678.1 MBOAT family O-acyltransferase [Kiritimatiellia bacterium]HQK43860.1 MBOAT family O-acyltransferase [Kiritimatiellia bacterium]